MIDKRGVKRVRQETEALYARMQTRQQELGMEALMVASEGDIRAILDDYYDSATGRAALNHDAAYKARLAIALRAATAAMEAPSAAELWLREPSTPLGGQAPTSLLDSDEGLVRVLVALIAIEHGLPS
ncbi:MAG: MbcA/ParS/Xre antitoxin family protein [Panacagrimonas sp.]